METRLILDCIMVLELLIKKYQEEEIDYDTFKHHTELKIKFLTITTTEKSSKEMPEVDEILQKCTNILMQPLVHAV